MNGYGLNCQLQVARQLAGWWPSARVTTCLTAGRRMFGQDVRPKTPVLLSGAPQLAQTPTPRMSKSPFFARRLGLCYSGLRLRNPKSAPNPLEDCDLYEKLAQRVKTVEER